MALSRQGVYRVPSKRERAMRAEYGARNKNLRAMGFENYREYLKSEIWQRIRRLILREGVECVGGCGRAATQVHHGRYSRDVLEGRDLRHLYPICGGCHFRSEFTKAGEKLGPGRATKKLRRKAHRNGRPLKRPGGMAKMERQDPKAAARRKVDDIATAKATQDDYRRRKKLWLDFAATLALGCMNEHKRTRDR